MEFKVNNVFQKLAEESFKNSLDTWANYVKSESMLSNYLEQELRNSNSSSETADLLSENYSRLRIQLKKNALLKEVETIPLITTSSFMGTFGGLVGVWLGFSALSLLQYLENFLVNLVIKLKYNNWTLFCKNMKYTLDRNGLFRIFICINPTSSAEKKCFNFWMMTSWLGSLNWNLKYNQLKQFYLQSLSISSHFVLFEWNHRWIFFPSRPSCSEKQSHCKSIAYKHCTLTQHRATETWKSYQNLANSYRFCSL